MEPDSGIVVMLPGQVGTEVRVVRMALGERGAHRPGQGLGEAGHAVPSRCRRGTHPHHHVVSDDAGGGEEPVPVPMAQRGGRV